MITRTEVLRRAQTIWQPGTVPYSQSKIHQPDGYRQDCSGYLSMCWDIPLGSGSYGGENTVTLVTEGWMREIAPADLQPGDAVGICGPGSAGDDGHIVLFEKWFNDVPSDDRYWMWEQAGGQSGPIRRVVNYPYDGAAGAWKAYRFRDITDALPISPVGDGLPIGWGPVELPSGPQVLKSYGLWPVNSGAIGWGPAFASVFADLHGGRAAFRVAVGNGNGAWPIIKEKLVIESGIIWNMQLPTGARGISFQRVPVDANDPCTSSVSLTIEYQAR
jgi:hypothetical protein